MAAATVVAAVVVGFMVVVAAVGFTVVVGLAAALAAATVEAFTAVVHMAVPTAAMAVSMVADTEPTEVDRPVPGSEEVEAFRRQAVVLVPEELGPSRAEVPVAAWLERGAPTSPTVNGILSELPTARLD